MRTPEERQARQDATAKRATPGSHLARRLRDLEAALRAITRCETCGALVAPEQAEKHAMWHAMGGDPEFTVGG